MSITKEEWRAIKSLSDEAAKVTTFLQRRRHNPDEACAVMGVALARLIDNRGMLESFIDALRAEYRVVRGLVRLAAVLLTLSATPAKAIDHIDCSMVIGHLNTCEEPVANAAFVVAHHSSFQWGEQNAAPRQARAFVEGPPAQTTS